MRTLTEDVVLDGEALPRLLGDGAPRPAIGIVMRKPGAQGRTSAAVEKVEGKVAFRVEAPGAISLVVFFSDARAGDRIAFGDMAPVPVRGTPTAIPAPPKPAGPAKLAARASLLKGTPCITPDRKPVHIRLDGRFGMTDCSASGQPVLVEISNTGGAEFELTVSGFDSIRIAQAGGVKSATGLVITMPNPLGRGSQIRMLTQMEGDLRFPLDAGQTIEIVTLFSSAATGDTITFGNAPAAKIR